MQNYHQIYRLLAIKTLATDYTLLNIFQTRDEGESGFGGMNGGFSGGFGGGMGGGGSSGFGGGGDDEESWD